MKYFWFDGLKEQVFFSLFFNIYLKILTYLFLSKAIALEKENIDKVLEY